MKLDIEELIAEAEDGDRFSQLELAKLYREGTKIPQNDQMAFHWSLMAAKQGHAEEIYHVGNAYALGIGVAQDLDEAIRWLSKLAYPKTTETSRRNDMRNAQMMMAGIHYWPGPHRNLAKAYGWVLLAICYSQPWEVEETPFNIEILEAQKEIAAGLETTKLRIESELTSSEREEGQRMASDLFKPTEEVD